MKISFATLSLLKGVATAAISKASRSQKSIANQSPRKKKSPKRQRNCEMKEKLEIIANRGSFAKTSDFELIRKKKNASALW